MNRIDADSAFQELAAATKENRSPNPDVVAWLAARAIPALETTGDARTRSIALGRALGVGASREPSRPEMNARDALKVWRAVGWAVQRQECLMAAGGMSEATANATANREAAARFHRALRTIQGWRKRWDPFCTDMLNDARARLARETEEAMATRSIIAKARKPRR